MTLSAEYIQTGNKDFISKKSQLFGIKNVAVKGESIIEENVMLRGDLRRSGGGNAVSILIGTCCRIEKDAIVKPPAKTFKGLFSYYPVKIGDYVKIGQGSLVEAAQIGSFVEIGKNCVIGPFTIIKDCAQILDGTILAPMTIVPPFSVFGTAPGDYFGSCISDLSEAWPEYYKDRMQSEYDSFVETTQG